MKKLIKDTLTNPETGRYSRKSIVLFMSFNALIIYEFVLPFLAVIFSYLFDLDFTFTPMRYVFDGLLLFVTGLLGITVADKKLNK